MLLKPIWFKDVFHRIFISFNYLLSILQKIFGIPELITLN